MCQFITTLLSAVHSNPKARLFNNAGTTDVNSYQFGIYGEWADTHFFAQGLATFGWQNFRNTRPGVVDTITSNPDGTTFVAGGKVGYLFDAGKSQVGPIGGLTYARARVNGYTESGDPVLTLTVGPQTAETLVASAGVQFRTPFMVNGRIISPYLNLTAEDDLIGNGRIIQFGATSAPLIINNWAIPNSLATCLRARSGWRCCAGDEQCGADGESFPNRRSSGRQRFLRYRRFQGFVLNRISVVWRIGKPSQHEPTSQMITGWAAPSASQKESQKSQRASNSLVEVRDVRNGSNASFLACADKFRSTLKGRQFQSRSVLRICARCGPRL